jgi:phosphomannomutase
VRNDGGDVVFAAEPWKHIHPSFGGWIDGVCSAAVLARLVADAETGLDGLRDPITERPYRKLSVPCPDGSKRAVMATLEASLPETFPESAVDTEHGVRLEFPDASWLLVRPSGTEPYVRIYAESDDVDALVEMARAAVEDAVADS